MSTTKLEGNTQSSLWEQVEVTLRPLEAWERPLHGTVRDDRMIVLARQPESHLPVPRAWLLPTFGNAHLAAGFPASFRGARPARASRVVAFYRTYGALRRRIADAAGQEQPEWVDRLSVEAQGRLSGEARWLQEPAWWVEEKAKELRLGYDLYRALKGDDLSGLRALLGGLPEGMRLHAFVLQEGRIIPYVAEEEVLPAKSPHRRVGSAAVEQPLSEIASHAPLRPLTDQECRWGGSQLLAGLMEAAQQRLHLRWAAEPGEEDRWVIMRFRFFPDLVTAMWLQLGDLLARGELYSTCPGCGGPFLASGKQRFCDKLCGDAWRQRHLYRHGDAKPEGQ